MSQIKATQAVTSMRRAIEEVLMAAGEGRIDTIKYAGISCETCIHKSKHAFQEPCSSCSSVRRDDKRDYRTTSRNFWTPSDKADVRAVKMFYIRYPKVSLDFFTKHPPVRCINPSCSHKHPPIHERGLCRDCYSILYNLVLDHHDRAQDTLIMASIADDIYEYEACMTEYASLHTWDRFVFEGRALPTEEDAPVSIHSLGFRQYYEAVKKNGGEAPSKRQLYRRGLKKHQVEFLSQILEIEN